MVCQRPPNLTLLDAILAGGDGGADRARVIGEAGRAHIPLFVLGTARVVAVQAAGGPAAGNLAGLLEKAGRFAGRTLP